MISSTSIAGSDFAADILKSTSSIKEKAAQAKKSDPQAGSGSGSTEKFSDYIKDALLEVNAAQKNADKKAVDIASGKSGNIHEAMLSVTQAQLAFNFSVQVRNKALEAYQEVMRMPV